MFNALQTMRFPSGDGAARKPLSRMVVALIALAIPLALVGTYMLRGGGKFDDGFRGRPALTAGGGAGAGDGIASRLGAVGSNLLKALGLRSPGERTRGELADSKGGSARRKSYSPGPRQRALAKVRPPAGVLEQPFAPVTESEVSSSAVENALAPGADVSAPSLGEQFSPGGNPGFGGGPGGSIIFPGGVGGGVVTPSPPPAIPPVTSAVPEPSTWALMLMGFLGIGASLRSNHRRSRRRVGTIKVSVAAL
jgi:hypothetical protein